MIDAALGALGFTVMVTFLATTLALLITFPLALPFAWGLSVSALALSAIERSRLAALPASGSPTRSRRSWPPGRGAGSSSA